MAHELALLLEEGVIDEVIGGLKTGKEAEVCLVRHQGEVVAAKVYKERHARSFQHNAAYKEGRLVRNTRTQRAMDRGSRFGQAAAEEAWKAAEADALYKLHAAGVRVPAPVLFYEGVLLMQLVVDAEGRPAPRLVDARPSREAAKELYRDLRRQVTTMLCGDLIHGDLSPYNVLLGEAGPTIIDFPQIISAAHNSRSEFFFHRDLENLRTHLATIEPELANARGDAAEIWRAFVRRELSPDFLPSGRPPPEQPHPGRHGGHHRSRSEPGGQGARTKGGPSQPGAPRGAGDPRQGSRPGAPRQNGQARGSPPSGPRPHHGQAPGSQPSHHPHGAEARGAQPSSHPQHGGHPQGGQPSGHPRHGGHPRGAQPSGHPRHGGHPRGAQPSGNQVTNEGPAHASRPGGQHHRSGRSQVPRAGHRGRSGAGPEVSYIQKSGLRPPKPGEPDER